MKKFRDAILVIIGIACIVFGVMFIMKAGDSRDAVAKELGTLPLSGVNAAYDQTKAGLAAKPDDVALTLQKLSLGQAKSNIGTIDFIQNSGILTIVIGVGFVFAGAGLVMKD